MAMSLPPSAMVRKAVQSARILASVSGAMSLLVVVPVERLSAVSSDSSVEDQRAASM